MSGLAQISAIHLRLDRKKITDEGTATSLEFGGKTITFNKTFADVQKITVAANSTTPVVAVYDFEDIPNPTSFDVYCFDLDGNQIACDFSWDAKGI